MGDLSITSHTAIVQSHSTRLAALDHSSAIAAIGSVVSITGTGYIANEPVTVELTGSHSTWLVQPSPHHASQPPGAAQCRGQWAAALKADTSGVVAGSFRVPLSCNTTFVRGHENLGKLVKVDVIGAASGLYDSGVLRIPDTQVLLAPVAEANTATASQAHAFVGSGFVAGELVTLHLDRIDPARGGVLARVATASTQGDDSGIVRVSLSVAPALPAGRYLLTAQGTTSGLTARTALLLPLLPTSG